MKEIKTVHIVWFSGTGGTAIVAEGLANAFAKHGISVCQTRLTKANKTDIAADLLVVLYPVYIMTSPKPVDEWIANTPAVDGIPAAVISVSGGGEVSPNTASRVSVINGLEQKGYNVRYESMLIMPANVFVSLDDDLAAMLLLAVPGKTEKVVSEMLSAKRIRTKPLFFDRFLAQIGAIEKKHSGSFAKKLKANDSCSGCCRCKINCPRSNITIVDGKPAWGKDCINCFRCLYGCPVKVITVSGFARKLTLKNGFDLSSLQQRTQHITEFPPVEQLTKSFMLRNLRKYLKE